MSPEAREAASSSSTTTPVDLFYHSLEAHAAALGVPNDDAFVKNVHFLCDQGVLMTPGGPRDPKNLVGFAHPADVMHAACLFPNAGT
jgi:hypothetical protein